MVHFWYMYTLIAIYLISPLLYGGLHGLDRKGKTLIFVLIVLVSCREICRRCLCCRWRIRKRRLRNE